MPRIRRVNEPVQNAGDPGGPPPGSDDPGTPESQGFSVRLSQGRGILRLSGQTLAPGVVCEHLDMEIPRMETRFDFSSGMQHVRHQRLALAEMLVTVDVFELESALRQRLLREGFTDELRISCDNDSAVVYSAGGGTKPAVPVSFRLVPDDDAPLPVLHMCDFRVYAPARIPAPVMAAQLAGIIAGDFMNISGLSLVFDSILKNALVSLLVPRGWRLPEYESVRLKGFSLESQRAHILFQREGYGSQDDAVYVDTQRLEDRRRYREKLDAARAGDILLAEGRIEDARAYYLSALERHSENDLLSMRIGWIDSTDPLSTEALWALIEKEQQTWSASRVMEPVRLAAALLKGDDMQALSAVESLIDSSHPLERSAAHHLAGSILEKHDPEGAARHYEAVLSVRRDNLPTLKRLLILYSETGNVQGIRQISPGFVAAHGDAAAKTNAYVLAGQALLDMDAAAAMEQFEKALQRDPHNCGAMLGMGRCLLKQGSHSKARNVLERLVRESDKAGDAQMKAQGLVAIGKTVEDIEGPERALSFYRQAVSASPENAQAHFVLGEALVVTASFREAADALARGLFLADTASATGKQPLEAMLTLAGIYLDELNQEEEAEKYLSMAMARYPDDAGALSIQQRLLKKQGRFTELGDLLEKLSDAGDENEKQDLLNETLAAYEAAGDMAGQEKVLRRLWATSREPAAVEKLAMILEKQEKWHDFILLMREAAGVFGSGTGEEKRAASSFLHRSAKIYSSRLDDPAGAAEVLEKASELDPGNILIQYELVEMLGQSGAYEEQAARLATMISRLSKEDALPLRADLAEVLFRRLGRPKEAAEYYTDVLDAEPGNVGVIKSLVEVYRSLKDWEHLAYFLEMLVESDDERINRASVYFELGEIAAGPLEDPVLAYEAFLRSSRMEKDADRARASARRALSTADQTGNRADTIRALSALVSLGDPERSIKDRMRLARLFEKQGRMAEAVMSYEKVLGIDPENEEARAAAVKISGTAGRWKDVVRFVSYGPLPSAKREHDLAILYATACVELKMQNEAVSAWRGLNEAWPDDPMPCQVLARLYADSGEWDRALDTIEHLLDLKKDDGDRARLMREQARILMQHMNDNAGGLEKLVEAARLNPSDLEEWRKIISLLQEQEMYVELESVITEALENVTSREPRYELLIERAAVRADRLERYEEAIADFKEAASLWGQRPPETVLRKLISALEDYGARQDELSFLKTLFSYEDIDFEERVEFGKKAAAIAAEGGDSTEAAGIYREILNVGGPEPETALKLLSLLDPEKDGDEYAQIIQWVGVGEGALSPGLRISYWKSAASLTKKQGRDREHEQALSNLLEIDIDDEDAFVELEQCLTDRGDYAALRFLYERRSESSGDSSTRFASALMLGDVLLKQMQDTEGAIKAYEKALDENAESTEAAERIVHAHIISGNLEEAESTLQKLGSEKDLLSLKENSLEMMNESERPGLILHLGEQYLEQGDKENAIRHLTEAAGRPDVDPEAHLLLARACSLTPAPDPDRAIECIGRAADAGISREVLIDLGRRFKRMPSAYATRLATAAFEASRKAGSINPDTIEELAALYRSDGELNAANAYRALACFIRDMPVPGKPRPRKAASEWSWQFTDSKDTDWLRIFSLAGGVFPGLAGSRAPADADKVGTTSPGALRHSLETAQDITGISKRNVMWVEDGSVDILLPRGSHHLHVGSGIVDLHAGERLFLLIRGILAQQAGVLLISNLDEGEVLELLDRIRQILDEGRTHESEDLDGFINQLSGDKRIELKNLLSEKHPDVDEMENIIRKLWTGINRTSLYLTRDLSSAVGALIKLDSWPRPLPRDPEERAELIMQSQDILDFLDWALSGNYLED